jgi:hypothetical protein
MVAVRVVQVAVHQVVNMVAMRHGLMTATGAMFVAFIMRPAVVLRRATRRVAAVDVKLVFLNSSLAHVMQMPVVQVIHVTVVLDARVPATGAVLVTVIFVMSCHVKLLAWM